MLAVTVAARALTAAPRSEVTLWRELRTASLPRTHVPVGYCWQNNRCCQSLLRPQHNYNSDLVSHQHFLPQRFRRSVLHFLHFSFCGFSLPRPALSSLFCFQFSSQMWTVLPRPPEITCFPSLSKATASMPPSRSSASEATTFPVAASNTLTPSPAACPTTSAFPSRLNANEVTGESSSSEVVRTFFVPTSHSVTFSPSPAQVSVLPSRLKATHQIDFFSLRVRIGFRVFRSQTLRMPP